MIQITALFECNQNSKIAFESFDSFEDEISRSADHLVLLCQTRMLLARKVGVRFLQTFAIPLKGEHLFVAVSDGVNARNSGMNKDLLRCN